MLSDYEAVAKLLKNSGHAVVLTGAGISTESGIPDYRGPQGLWRKYDPIKYVSRSTFETDPKTFWEFNLPMWMQYKAAKPNKAHFLVAELERLGFIKAVITQNIDGLHKRLAARMCTKSMATLRQLLVCDAIRNTLWKKLGSNSTTVTYLNAAAEDYCVPMWFFSKIPCPIRFSKQSGK